MVSRSPKEVKSYIFDIDFMENAAANYLIDLFVKLPNVIDAV